MSGPSGPLTPRLGIQTFADTDTPDLGAAGLGVILGELDSAIPLAKERGGFEWAGIESNAALSTSSGTAVVLLTFPAATYDGALCIFEFAFTHLVNDAGAATQFYIGEGGSIISPVWQVDVPNSTLSAAASFRKRFTPSAGAHTYQVLWNVLGGTSTIDGLNFTTLSGRITKK